MIRLRSKKLLSGVSTVAVLAAFGAIDPALAAPIVVTAAGNPNAPIVTVPGDSSIDVQAGSLVNANGAGHAIVNANTLTFVQIASAHLKGNVFNTGVINTTAPGAAIFINNSQIDGKIINSGSNASIHGDTGDGIRITGASTLTGITNDGTIFGNSTVAHGIFLGSGVIVNGDIKNSSTGSISASGFTATGVRLGMASMTGNIDNSGFIGTSFLGAVVGRGVVLANGIVTGSIINRTGGTISAFGFSSGVGVRVSGGALRGNIENSGFIGGFGNVGAGILLSGGLIDGSIINKAGGTISAQASSANGIAITGGSLTGAIDNSGLIFAGGTTANGVSISGGSVAGSIVNHGGATISATGSNAAGVNLSGGVLGGIDNSGLITAPDFGININGGTLSGKLLNNTGGVIEATTSGGHAIDLSSGSIGGGIENRGTIRANSSNGVAVNMSGGSLVGGIENKGLIEATGTNGVGIDISGGTVLGDIHNSSTGQITASGDGINLSLAVFGNNIVNDGSIMSFSEDGIQIDNPAMIFAGDIINNGQIGTATTEVGGNGITINVDSFTGGVTNSEGALINANNDGINVTVANTMTGDILNAGSIINGSDGIDLISGTFNTNITNDGSIEAGTGIELSSGVTMTGDITNTGDITANSTGIDIEGGAALTGNIANSGGTITAGANGILIETGATVDGDVTNGGTISATGVGGIGVNVQGAVTNGGVTNTTSGVISGAVGIAVTGSVANGIVNDGSITAGVGIRVSGGGTVGTISNSGAISSGSTAISLTGAGGATTITQTGGLIDGGESAIEMNNGQADIFNGNGGVLSGDINLNNTDVFNMGPSGSFAWSNGSTFGAAFASFNKTGAGTALLGTDEAGVDGAGVTVDATLMTMAAGTLYLDNSSQANVGTYTQTGGLLQFHVTPGVGGVIGANDYAQIAATGAATLGGQIGVYLDPTTFATAALATTTTLTYDNVISSTGYGATRFTNVGDNVLTSSPFFAGKVIYDLPGNVDITLNRLAFNNALIAVTQNQKAVGGALEQIYDNLVLSGDMQDAFAALFGATTTAGAQAMLDELSGAQHAQLLQTTQSLSGMVNSLVEERLDGVLISQDGVRYAGTPGQRYAQAVAIASDASSSGLRGSQGLTRGESGMSAWLRGFGNWVNVDQDPEATGYQQDSNGLIGGVDFAINNNATVGGAVAYAQTDVDFNTPPDNADLDTWQLNLFGSYGFGRFYADGQASYGWHDVSATRSIDLGPPAGSVLASSGYDASAWSASAELGAIWRLGRVNMQPSVGLAYVGADVDGFRETGPAYALNVSGSSSDSLASTLALRASGQWMMGKTQVVPDIKLGWRHEFDDERQSFTATFLEDATAPMSIISSAVQPDSLVLSTGATFGVTKNFEVFFDVNGLYNADASATNASGGVRVTW